MGSRSKLLGVCTWTHLFQKQEDFPKSSDTKGIKKPSGAINKVARHCGLSCYTVWGIWKHAEKVQENGNAYYASELRKYKPGRRAKYYAPQIIGMPCVTLLKRGKI